MKEKEVTARWIRIKTILAIIIWLVLLISAFMLIRSLFLSKPKADDPFIHPELRIIHQFNENVFSRFFSNAHLVKEFPLSAAATRVRVNGALGLKDSVDAADWRLKVARAPGDTLILSLDEIKQLPRTEITFDFKCIEGWSQVSHWCGVKMTDFIKAYHLESAAGKMYMGLRTPDNGYYVGIDRASALHPQTLLCYELNGQPLPLNQGFPLRLIIPVKYGIKHLKRIGVMYFSDTAPPDFWAEQGYDYYSGL